MTKELSRTTDSTGNTITKNEFAQLLTTHNRNVHVEFTNLNDGSESNYKCTITYVNAGGTIETYYAYGATAAFVKQFYSQYSQ